MRRALVALILLSTSTLTAADRLDTPWGTSHGDNHGTQRTTTPTGDWSAGIELAWEFDTRAHGLDRVAARGPLTFDSAGNLYWITSVGTPDGRQVVASVSPAGALRWASAPLTRGGAYTQSAALVGLERIYAIGGGASYDYDGDGTPGRQLLALDKSTGATLWSLDLDGDWDGAGTADHDLGGLGQNGPLTPVLSDGRLFVALIGSAGLHLVQVDAAVGALLCCDLIDPAITWGANDSGHIVHVADVFGPGLDGLFFNLDEGAANDFATGAGLRDVIALRVSPGSGAALAWTAPGGNRARSSLTYSATTGHLYAHTWNDQPVIAGGAPAALTIYDPATGAVLGSANPGFGHGFYDLGALDFDNRSLIAGGPDGRLAVYTDDGTGHLTTRLYLSAAPWHGEYRVFGQIAPGPAGRTLVFTGTNSRVSDLGPGYTARVVVLDASRAQLPSLDDGPACFDDITVQAGADEAAARAAAPLLSENFESGFATIPGPVAQKPGWTDVSGSAASGTPLVVPDPTGAGQGRVLVLDPLGNTAVATRRQGARVALPLPAPNLADEWYAIIRWRQWRADLGDDVEVRSDWNPGVYQWDQSGRIHTAAGWSMDAPLTAGRWQLIELHHDYTAGTTHLCVDGVLADGWPDYIDSPGDPVGALQFFMSPTALVANDGLTPHAPVAEYDTGIAADNSYTTRGGPFLGPDGQVYYFHATTGHLVALRRIDATRCADTNCDGAVDTADIDSFVHVVVTGTTAPGCPTSLVAADANGDGAVDTADIDSFVHAVIHGACP